MRGWFSKGRAKWRNRAIPPPPPGETGNFLPSPGKLPPPGEIRRARPFFAGEGVRPR